MKWRLFGLEWFNRATEHKSKNTYIEDKELEPLNMKELKILRNYNIFKISI